MGLKHGKYIYVERKDGWYVKVRVLGVRFRRESKEAVDINDPKRYVVLSVKTREPPRSSIVVREDDVPSAVREMIYSV